MKAISPPVLQIRVSFCFGGVLLLVLFALCFQFAPDPDAYGRTASLTVAIFVAGWATGWVAGTLIAPYDAGEGTVFSKIAKGIWAFASGYLLAKIDPIFRSSSMAEVIPFSDLTLFRLLLYFSVTTIVMMIVFFARSYLNWHRDRTPPAG